MDIILVVAPNRKDVNSINKNQIRTLGTNLIQHLSFLTKYIMPFFLDNYMSKEEDNSSEVKLFVTEFPKGEFGIVDYLQGRVHFALMDQMKLMHKSGMKQEQIKEAIMKTVSEIVSNFEPKKESESS